MADALIGLMDNLGYKQFSVVGHDKGGRVAYRMALDHPDKIARLAVLDIIPTGEMAALTTFPSAIKMPHWWLLSQLYPFPETLIQQSNKFFLRYTISSWSVSDQAIDGKALDEYSRCFQNPAVIRDMCEDYRAGSTIDIAHDKKDSEKGRRIHVPLLALWSSGGFAAAFGDPLAIWKKWALQVTGGPIEAGHFLMEEVPETIYNWFIRFFSS